MSINQSTILRIARRTLVVAAFAAIAISAFAVLGEKGKNSRNRSLLSNKNYSITPGSFSLKSNYNFRGSQVLNTKNTEQYINLNTVLTYKKGNSTYIIPLKKKIYITTANAGFTISH